MKGRIRADVAAFAAGLLAHPGKMELSWQLIAASLDDLGLGKYTPEEVCAAVGEWCEITMSAELDAEDDAALELRWRSAS